MNAIILTEEQAAALVMVRSENPSAFMVLEPRRLEDGRLILNSDVLDDPFFADASKPWAQILAGQTPAEIKPNTEAASVVAASLIEVRSEIVTLTEAELAEPADALASEEAGAAGA